MLKNKRNIMKTQMLTASFDDLDPLVLFNITDFDGLPNELVFEIERGRRAQSASITSRIYKLFEKKKMLTINEILVGYFRSYGEVLKRDKIGGLIGSLVNSHKVRRCGFGIYTSEMKPGPSSSPGLS